MNFLKQRILVMDKAIREVLENMRLIRDMVEEGLNEVHSSRELDKEVLFRLLAHCTTVHGLNPRIMPNEVITHVYNAYNSASNGDYETAYRFVVLARDILKLNKNK